MSATVVKPETFAKQAHEFDRSIGELIGEAFSFFCRATMTLAFMSPAILFSVASAKDRGPLTCFAAVAVTIGNAFLLHSISSHRKLMARVLCALIVPVTLVVSSQMALSNIDGIRRVNIKKTENAGDAKSDANTRRARLEARRQAQADIAGEESPKVIEANIADKKSKNAARWAATNGCTQKDIQTGDAKRLCSDFQNLNAKLEAAKERDRLQGEIDALDKKIEQARADGPVVTFSNDAVIWFLKRANVEMHDSDVDYIAEMLLVVALELLAAVAPTILDLRAPDFRRRRVSGDILARIDALEADIKEPIVIAKGKAPNPIVANVLTPIKEAVTSVPVLDAGVAIVESAITKANDSFKEFAEEKRQTTKKASGTRARNRRQAKAVACGKVSEWLPECTTARAGARVKAQDGYDDYCGWCERKKVEPLTLQVFGNELNKLGIEKDKVGGNVYYMNLALLSKKGKLTVVTSQDTSHQDTEQFGYDVSRIG